MGGKYAAFQLASHVEIWTRPTGSMVVFGAKLTSAKLKDDTSGKGGKSGKSGKSGVTQWVAEMTVRGPTAQEECESNSWTRCVNVLWKSLW